MVESRNLAALATLALVAVGGCVSSPVIAPMDSQIFLSASPTNIVLDEFANPPVTSGSTAITAQILSASGVPQSRVSVVFSTNGGALASQPPGQPTASLKTDDNGFVSDTLTLVIGDPDSATVTVRSGNLSNSIEISKTETAQNQPPFAVLDTNIGNSALIGQSVAYDATGSADPDGDPITCYQFHFRTSENMTSQDLACPTNPSARCEVSQGTDPIVSRTWDRAIANVEVRLRVSDDPSIPCDDMGPAVPFSSFTGLAFLSHDVVCDRFQPMANAGNNQTAFRTCGMSSSQCTSDSTCAAANPGDVCRSDVVASLNGNGSTGGDSGIERFDWNCGNGTVTCFADPAAPGSGPTCPLIGQPTQNCCRSGSGGELNRVSCVYPMVGSAQTIAVQLQVTNNCGVGSGTSSATITIP